MPYRDQPEYTKEIRDRIDGAIKNYYKGDDVEVEWHNESARINYKYKVDVTVIVVIEDRKINLQIKRSPNHENSFSIGKHAMTDYLTKDLPVLGLLVDLKDAKELYLFDWKQFVELAKRKKNRWKMGDFYVIRLPELTKVLQYKTMKI